VKRFYRAAGVAPENGAFQVTLDGRPARTPAKRALALPRQEAAQAIAAEWSSQGEEFEPAELRLTRFANTAIDRVAASRELVIEEVVRFAATDLLCYRATEPQELVRRQAEAWQPLLDWAAARYGAPLEVTDGIVPARQRQEALEAFRRAVAAYDDFALTALHAATAASGSLVIGLALAEGRIRAAEAFAAALLDEHFQAEKWGVDAEAEERRRALKADIEAASHFLALMRQ
jgi:chaperone required for assembly of F1-ATPase